MLMLFGVLVGVGRELCLHGNFPSPLPWSAAVDPEIAFGPNVEVAKAAGGVKANAGKPKGLRPPGELFVSNPRNDDIHGAAAAVIAPPLALGYPIARDDPHLGGLEVSLRLVDQVEQPGFDPNTLNDGTWQPLTPVEG